MIHEGGLQPSIPTEAGFRDCLLLSKSEAHCPCHCSSRVARGIRGILTCRGPLLPPPYRRQSPQSCSSENLLGRNNGCGSRSLPDLTGHLTARTGDGHAPPLSSSSKTFNLAFILLSSPVRFPALLQLNRKLHPLWCSPANSFKFQPCDRTPQAAGLTVSLRH